LPGRLITSSVCPNTLPGCPITSGVWPITRPGQPITSGVYATRPGFRVAGPAPRRPRGPPGLPRRRPPGHRPQTSGNLQRCHGTDPRGTPQQPPISPGEPRVVASVPSGGRDEPPVSWPEPEVAAKMPQQTGKTPRSVRRVRQIRTPRRS
jgi:hypothetical protein